MGGFFLGHRKTVRKGQGMTLIGDIAFLIGGYVASIYTWPRLKVLINGAQAEAAKLRAKADALISAVKK